jgi:phage terminase large subunit GpA-like protein
LNACVDVRIIDTELRDLITPEYRKKMLSLFRKEMHKWPKISVGESLVDFAERKRILVAGTSARPGPYRYSVTPYLREPAEEASESSMTTELVIIKGTQTGGTDGIMMNHELYCIEYGLGPVQYISSDDDLALEHMERRISPMIKAAKMNDKIIPPAQGKNSRISGDTKRAKSYGGTFLRTTGARSESKLSSLPSRILHIDEIDKYPIALRGGGDAVEKAVRRTDSYGNLKKIIYISTPKRKSESRIDPLYRQGDMRRYNVPCPKCGKLQPLYWHNLKWDKDEDGRVLVEYDEDNQPVNDPTYYECEHCGYHIKYHEKSKIMKEAGFGGRAKWIPTKKPDRPGIKSWWMPAWYGFRSWLDIALQWDRIQGDSAALQEFVNDVMGEVYEENIDKPDEHFLAARAETDWDRGQIPDGVVDLYIGVDVHPDRLEAHLVGFGNFKEAWSCDYYVYAGEPYEPNDATWDKLEDRITNQYETIDGRVLPISVCMIDSGGVASDVVHQFCSRFPYNPRQLSGVFPVFGKQNITKIWREYPGTIPQPDIHIDDQKLKQEIYQNLKKKPPVSGARYPSGYLHYHSEYNTDFFSQLTAEDIIEESNKNGIVKTIIANPHQRRNETLDTLKLALAGLYWRYLKYFELMNAVRKKKKKKEIPPSWAYFWAMMGCDVSEPQGDEEK